MDWQELLLSRLQIDMTNPQLVIDETGVLLHPDFERYLTKRNISHFICKTPEDLLKMGHRKSPMIICGKSQIPTYLKNKYTIVPFTYNMLPVQFEPELRERLTIQDIILMLSSFCERGKPKLVSRFTLTLEIDEAKKGIALQRASKLKEQIKNLLSNELNSYNIMELGKLWGKYLYNCYNIDAQHDMELQSEIDLTVLQYIIDKGIKDIFYSPVKALKSVDKIQDYLADLKKDKVALVCFDGMGWVEWELIKSYLQKNNFSFDERAQFALIPTITSISRSALFSGEYKTGFGKHSDDERAFNNYWKSKGKEPVFFREVQLLDREQLTGYNRVAVLFNFIDDISHGSVVPYDSDSKFSYFETIENYCIEARIEKVFDILKGSGFNIYICSDHGTAISIGNGRKIDKYLIDTESKRATVVDKSILLETTLSKEIQYTIPFVDEKVAIIAEDRTMYGTLGEKKITHGGVTVEELIVPFVEVAL